MIEEYLSSSNNIINDAKTLENLLKESHSLEVRNVQLTDELEDLKQKISEASEKKEELSDRSQAIKDKFHDFDEVTKHENERHASEIKNFFKNILGMKVHLDFLEDDENSVKLTLNFREKEDYPITLSYDFSSGNYKLISLQPEHPKFEALQKLLEETQDIQAFIANYRTFLFK